MTFFCGAVKGTDAHKRVCTLSDPAFFIVVDGEI